MKPLIYAVGFIFTCSIANAQKTNTFPDNGSAGVGTLSPTDALEIRALNGNHALRITNDSNSITDSSGIRFFQAGYEKAVMYTLQDSFFINRSGNGHLLLNTEGGNVGIGTRAPEKMLTVAGAIKAQGPVGYLLDEKSLSLWDGTILVDDITAEGGKAMFRSAAATHPIMWFGPYQLLPSGNYLAQFRMKVASNVSNRDIMHIDVAADLGGAGKQLAIKTIKANDFRASNEWQIFTLPFTVDGNMRWLELRGVDFNPGITDVYLDYINVIAGDNRGFYSKEFTITANGYVGILTDSPTYPLSVNGGIRAKEVIVESTNWADYVFDESYKLQPLAEVEQHIAQNKHLPGLPSAKDVASKGISLGEMQSLMLAKIEELTLHQIELEKTQKRLESRIKELEQENTALKQR